MSRVKGFIFGLVCLTLVLPLAACGDGATPEPTATIFPIATPSSAPATETPAPVNLVVTTPDGIPPTLDGTMSADEWSDAKRELFSDGSELFMKHHEGYLYLGLRASKPGMIVGNIFVDQGDSVSILHSSAALGTAIYEKSADGFQQTQDFVWRCRNSGSSPAAQAAREKFFQEEGWLADISYMGIPEELEYKIAMPNGSLRLAVTFTPASDVSVRIYWPLGLADDSVKAPQGEFPKNMQFSPSAWATVTADDAGAQTSVRSLDQMTMIFVPGGTFQMGSTEDEVKAAIAFCKQHYSICNDWFYMREHPQHLVTVSDFWLDQTEVTNAQYRQCVEAGTCAKPSTCQKGEETYADSTKADHPAVCVGWDDAQAYCEWTGARLPTEAEWEYAFRGGQNLVYPWGNLFDGSKLNYCDVNCGQSHADDGYDDGFAKSAPVGSFSQDISWCGALDMSGNVSEWVADWSARYSSAAELNPTGPSSGTDKILRGCNWYFQLAYCRGATRPSAAPDTRYDYLGFRCASSALP
jgi:formylglycine-generating enzyme required for sulfatase activity